MIYARREFERVDGHRCHAFHEFVLARIHHEQGERWMKLGETSLLACVKQLGRLAIHKKRIGFVDDNTMCSVILCVCVCQDVDQKRAATLSDKQGQEKQNESERHQQRDFACVRKLDLGVKSKPWMYVF